MMHMQWMLVVCSLPSVKYIVPYRFTYGALAGSHSDVIGCECTLEGVLMLPGLTIPVKKETQKWIHLAVIIHVMVYNTPTS